MSTEIKKTGRSRRPKKGRDVPGGTGYLRRGRRVEDGGVSSPPQSPRIPGAMDPKVEPPFATWQKAAMRWASVAVCGRRSSADAKSGRASPTSGRRGIFPSRPGVGPKGPAPRGSLLGIGLLLGFGDEPTRRAVRLGREAHVFPAPRTVAGLATRKGISERIRLGDRAPAVDAPLPGMGIRPGTGPGLRA